jgi:hypothetical protein
MEGNDRIAGVQKLKQVYMDQQRYKRMSEEFKDSALNKEALNSFHQAYMTEFSKELMKEEREYKEKFIKESLDTDRVLTEPIMHKILTTMIHQHKDEFDRIGGFNRRIYDSRFHYILENYFNEFMYHYTTYLIQINKQLNDNLLNEIRNRAPQPYFTWKESNK